MAAGNLTVFNDLTRQLSLKLVDLDTDVYRFALVTNAVVPVVGATLPVFGTYTEVATGNGYTTPGEALTAGMTAALVGAVTTWDTTTNPSWTQHASGPTDIWWGIIYNDQGATKYAAAFVEMGDAAAISLQAGNISYAFNASGIATVTRT